MGMRGLQHENQENTRQTTMTLDHVFFSFQYFEEESNSSGS